MRERLDRVASCAELDVEAADLPSSAIHLTDDAVLAALADVAALANDASRLQALLAGVAAQRSRREDGRTGLAAVQGHATPASLIQAITGGTKADANRQVRVGTSLLESTQVLDGKRCEGEPDGADAPATNAHVAIRVWHEPLRAALLAGRVTAAQHDAIRSGLGEPRLSAETASDGVPSDAVIEAWSLAAESLIDEASSVPVEELAKRARTMRDMLDPVGAEERFARRFESRSFRMWSDAEGQRHAKIDFDDEMALWVEAIRDAAMRPRRGGPRFIADDERAAAVALTDDARTNEQLEYDLFMDLIRSGALANAEDVFGARQPGVRLVIVKDAGTRDPFGRLLAAGHAEDGGDALPGSVIDRAVCISGEVEVTVDSCGTPLDVGREKRLFTPKQRLALVVRDGGCRWPGCGRNASYCEAHHIDHFVDDHGRTDVGRGILLCRFHHMALHNQGWKIHRRGDGPFLLMAPSATDAVEMPSKAAWDWAWDPPPPAPRHRVGWRQGSSAA